MIIDFLPKSDAGLYEMKVLNKKYLKNYENAASSKLIK
jgi:hypothetical protein